MSYQNVSGKNITEFVLTGFATVQFPLTIGLVMLIFYIVLMLANMTNMYFIATDKRLHRPMYLFICNLAIVDMVYGTSTCPSMIGTLVVGYKTISFLPCIVQMYMFHISGVMEAFSITMMAFDRLIAIGNPLRYHNIVTNFRSVLLTVSLWMMACVIIASISSKIIPLPLCFSSMKFAFCDFGSVIRTTCVDPLPYFTIIYIASFVVNFGTFSFVCLSYLYIFIVVVRMASNTEKKKALNTCVSHLIVIACFYIPLITVSVLTGLGVVLSPEQRNGLLIGTILGPCIVNPFIYCFRTQEIRNKLSRILSKVGPSKETTLVLTS